MLNGMLIYMVKDLFITDTTHITEQPFVMLTGLGNLRFWRIAQFQDGC